MHYLLVTVCTVACLRSAARAKPCNDNTLDDSGYNPETEKSDSNQTIFSIPSRLKQGYEITVMGQRNINSRERLTFSLVTGSKEDKSPDLNNVACQLMADFEKDEITLNHVVNGEETRIADNTYATDLFNHSNFTVVFMVVKEKSIQPNVGASVTQKTCELKHEMDDILFLTVDGVEKVEEIHFLLA